MRYLAIVSYDGSNYFGFQKQEKEITVQQMIERAFRNMTQQEVTIYSAGRTDKGVHALGQAFHFDFNEIEKMDLFIEGLNKRLPIDIRIIKIKKVKDYFHARFDAKKKTYTYTISKVPSSVFDARYEVYVKDFNIDVAKNCVLKFIGTHDFKGFTKYTEGKETVRTIDQIKVLETKTKIRFIFTGKGFLRYMVRSIMGTIIEVSTGKKDITLIDELFETKDRKKASKTAEARGLCLTKIYY